MIRWILARFLLAVPARAADLIVLSAGALKPVTAEVVPAFDATTGDKVVLRNDTVGAPVHRIGGGEAFDIVLMSLSALGAALSAHGRIASRSSVRLATVGIGVGVRAGAPAPDICTVGACKSAMPSVRAVAIIDPAPGGSSGVYLDKVLRTLRIAEALAPKLILVNGGLAAEAMVDGRADLVVHQISEIVEVPGISVVGPLPAEIRNETVCAGAVASESTAPEAARAFLAALSGQIHATQARQP